MKPPSLHHPPLRSLSEVQAERERIATMNEMLCPEGHEGLEFVSGDFDTGVVAPDGYRERRYEEGFYCARCQRTYDPSDCEPMQEWPEPVDADERLRRAIFGDAQ